MKDPLGKGCKKKGEENCLEIPIFIVSESDVLFESSFRICWGHGRKGDVMYHLDGQVCIKFGVLSTPIFPIIDKTKCNTNLKFKDKKRVDNPKFNMYKLDHPGSMSRVASAVSSWGSLSQLIGGFRFFDGI